VLLVNEPSGFATVVDVSVVALSMGTVESVFIASARATAAGEADVAEDVGLAVSEGAARATP
jgi:hypothetical protein